MFWLQENLILMKKMSKKCSTDQRFIRKRNTIYKIGTLVLISNNLGTHNWLYFYADMPGDNLVTLQGFKEDILFWKRDPFGSFIYYYTKCNILFNNNKNTSHHSLSVLDDLLKQKMKSPKHLSCPSDPKTNSKTKNPN